MKEIALEEIAEAEKALVASMKVLSARAQSEVNMRELEADEYRRAKVENETLKADLVRAQRDLDEARVLNGELAKTNDSLVADIAMLKARLEHADPVHRQGAVRLPIAKRLVCSELEPSDVIGSMELTQTDADAIADMLSDGFSVKLVGVVGINGKSRELHHVAIVSEPAPLASDKLPMQLTVKFEKTPEQLRDLVLDELIKHKRKIAEGVEYVKLNVSQLIKLVEGAVQENLHLCNSCGGDHRVDRSAAYEESVRILTLLKDAQGRVDAPASRTKPVEVWLLDQVAILKQQREATHSDENRLILNGMVQAYAELGDRAVREGWVRTKL